MIKTLKNLGALFLSFHITAAHSELLWGDALRLSSDIPAWNTKFQNAAPTECRETSEIAGAFLCASFDSATMHSIWIRASVWAEGYDGSPVGTLVSRSAAAELLEGSGAWIGGYNITGDSLMGFYQAAQERCSSESNYCLNPAEQEAFQTLILPMKAKGTPFAIISYAVHGAMSYKEVVTHEIMHAQYFLQPTFRKAVDAFWADPAQISAEDKEAIARILTHAGYSVSTKPGEDFVLKNEFQAYLLMSNPDDNQLEAFVGKFREPLLKTLKAKGAKPVKVGV